ncbi:MAG: HlyC/CorC family transporter [Clostridiales bacterium]|nr:HlyC/CorC family transporter [Clostridiales bacterium]
MDPSNLSTQMTSAQIGMIIALVALVLLSAFFSSAETAFTTVNRVRLHTLESNGVKWAKRAGKMIDSYDKLITTILIGNNIVNIVGSSLATVFFVSIIANQSTAVTVSTVVMTLAVLIFGEITPKTLAKEHPEGMVRVYVGVLWLLEGLFFPLTFIFSQWKKLLVKIFKFKKSPGITEDELLTYVETAESEGGIDEHESELIRSAIEFEDLDVGDIMVHRVGVAAIADTASVDDVAKAFRDNGYSRMLVYSGTIDTVVGVIHEKDFLLAYLDGAKSFKPCIQPTVCLSANMKISAALRMMQKGKIHMAVVVDEYGGTSGIITMEDILEELVGEIYDEHDEIEEFIKKTAEGTFIINGNAPLLDAFEYMDVDIREEFESSSVGGWVTELMEKIPVAGEKTDYANMHIVVTRSTPKRVAEVQITVSEPEEK